MNTILEHLKNKHLLWQANQTSHSIALGSSGFKELDEQLAGGLPERGVVDIQSPIGIGELRLLMPYLRQQQEQHLLVFIAPPLDLNSEMLAEFGLSLHNILVLRPASAKLALWSAEQCLKSGCCKAVLMWHDSLEIAHVKRLQLAAEKGDALQVIFRQVQTTSLSLPVTLGMTLAPHPEGIQAHITKCKGAWPGQPFSIAMKQYWPQLTLSPKGNNVVPLPRRWAS